MGLSAFYRVEAGRFQPICLFTCSSVQDELLRLIVKTRVLHTKVWKDEYFYNLEDKERLAFLYLMTNENVNMIGTYELNDVEFRTWLKTTQDNLISIKQKFQDDCKFLFRDGWVHIVNHNKYNSYGNGMQVKAYKREQSLVPKDIKEFFDTSIDTSIHTRPKYKIRNKKLKTEGKIFTLTLQVKNEIANQLEVNPDVVKKTYDKIKDYEKSSGKKYKDYPATIRNWIRKDLESGKVSKEKVIAL